MFCSINSTPFFLNNALVRDPGFLKTFPIIGIFKPMRWRRTFHTTRGHGAGSTAHAVSDVFAALPLAGWVYLMASITKDLKDSIGLLEPKKRRLTHLAHA